MANATLVPIGEYLKTTYRPDRDYMNRKQWKVRALTEHRVQTSATHYRIADVCVVRSSDPFDGTVRVSPLLCIEILSKGDTPSETQERADDYEAMGVEHIWVIDPWKRHGYFASSRGFTQPSDGVLAYRRQLSPDCARRNICRNRRR